MGLMTGLMIMIAIVVAATDLIVYYHLRRNPEKLTLGYTFLVIDATLVPISVILEDSRRRKLL
jgi:Na+/serine symporter